MISNNIKWEDCNQCEYKKLRNYMLITCLQANLCYVDIDSQTIQLPEELPSFPQRGEFVTELVELLSKHKVNVGQIDRLVFLMPPSQPDSFKLFGISNS